MPRVTHVKSARKDNPAHGIKKGDSYYWWAFRMGRTSIKKFSKTPPKPWELTQSAFWQEQLQLIDQIETACGSAENALQSINMNFMDDLSNELEGVLNDIENLKDQAEESLYNLPEQLQDSHMLNDRMNDLESWHDEMDSARDRLEELSPLIDEYNAMPDPVEGDDDDVVKEEKFTEIEDLLNDIVGEIGSTDYQGS
ncbi:unnamed protein product [marine sediment metagenome]|uniref:Uncharacterized protein n=1 Tax=marine sediment metagenome TaxID=412755 RepID=X0V0Y1_9ZZZZ